MTTHEGNWTRSAAINAFIQQHAELCLPERIHVCDGSAAEAKLLQDLMVQTGTLVPLNPEIRPNSFLARSDKADTARVEGNTYICPEREADAGATNIWRAPAEMRAELKELFTGCMTGRTMYVVPFSMGPVGGAISQVGVQVTDSPYVAASMRVMTRIGTPALRVAEADGNFVQCVHTLGAPLSPGQQDSPWPCNAETKRIVHFPEERKIVSYGSGYGGNALLGKKCFALRIASVMARDKGWFAEHMLILGVTNPEGEKKYVAAAFPSACGKTNMAMMKPTLPGWKVECVGDDIAWMKFDENGQLRAINPEAGFFGVAPGTNRGTNPYCMDTLAHDTIFTNCAMTPDGDVWWEGKGDEPARAVDWLRREWTPDCGRPAAHPNARFAVSAAQCPIIDDDWESPDGVPIEAVIFGGRRSTVVPLVFEARDWSHGTFLGSIVNSERTAAAEGEVGELVNDPFAMRPFCGYNIGDYFQHWLNMGKNAKVEAKLPKIFYVNWFRKDAELGFLWPGFGENSRVLKWIFERMQAGASKENAVETPIGLIPPPVGQPGGIDLSGLDISDELMDRLFEIDADEWMSDTFKHGAFYDTIGDSLPPALRSELSDLRTRLEESKSA